MSSKQKPHSPSTECLFLREAKSQTIAVQEKSDDVAGLLAQVMET